MSSDKPSEKPVERRERHLRVEAGAAQWPEFDEAQQQAYLRIAKMIAEAIRDMPPLDAALTDRDAVRRTRTAFVVGGRGTGKTTVLDTFRRDSTTSDKEVPPIRSGLDEETRKRHELRATERGKILPHIRGRVVWLETLDMEPLPADETNLLAAILVRLEDAARKFSGEGAPAARKSRPRGLIEPSSDYHSALLDLQRLQTDVALAWEGNLRERRGSLDPDAYAVEVMRVETSRLSLNSKFDDTLRKLAQYVFRSRDVEDVLFILPVDDFDLNPPICLDLLRVLRLISIPRLFTIVLGDLYVASTVLSLKLSNDLGSIVRQLQTPMLAVVPATVASLAGDVAANAIRKLLPPGQRIELAPMLLPESMNFRPLGATDQDFFLHDLFAQYRIHSGWQLPPVRDMPAAPLERALKPEYSSLRQLLLAPKLSDAAWTGPSSQANQSETGDPSKPAPTQPLSRAVAAAAIYSGSLFLHAPPRRVADTWLELHKVLPDATLGATAADDRPTQTPEEKKKAQERDREAFDPLLTFFAEACRAALRETPIFIPEERDDIERAVSRTVGGTWTLRSLPVTVRTETTAPRPIELAPATAHPTRDAAPGKRRSTPTGAVAIPPAHIHVAESQGWQIEIDTGGNRRPGTQLPGVPLAIEERRARRLLSANAVTALIIYHDLLTMAPGGGSFQSHLLTRASLATDWATTEWKLTPPITFEWPEPPCTTFFDYDCFKVAWNDVINSRNMGSPGDAQVERLAFGWLAIGTTVVRRKSPQVQWWSDVLHWGGLIAQMEEMVTTIKDPQFTESYRYTEWLLRVAELLMPELGMPVNVRKAFAGATALHDVWRKSGSILRERRRQRLQKLHEVDAVFAEQLRAAFLQELPELEELRPEQSDITGVPEQPSAVSPANLPRPASGNLATREPEPLK